jgi:NAD-specific glutamate dehydrogenase
LPYSQKTISIQLHRRSIVINHLRDLFKADENTAVVYIYCSYKAQYTVIQLLEALLKQLAFRRLTTNSVDLLQKEYMGRSCRPSLDTLTAVLKTEIETYSCVFIVMDALDECFPEQVQVDLLETIQSLIITPHAKLLVTSRHIPSIKSAIHADIMLEIMAMERDVRSHVEARIYNNNTLKRLVTKAPSMEEKVVRTVVDKAQGMYVVVELIYYWHCSDNLPLQVSASATAHGQPC